jgi:DNA invertase Pin-like site-specific DNA recombinase
MLQFVKENSVKYVVVHKVDRLARNRADDVAINLALHQAGAQLVSVSENIDQTPSGLLLHGIMSSIAEFYSRNLATEVTKGLVQKAKNVSTPGSARLAAGTASARTTNAMIAPISLPALTPPDMAPTIRCEPRRA